MRLAVLLLDLAALSACVPGLAAEGREFPLELGSHLCSED